MTESDFDLEATFSQLKKSSQTSLTMVVIGALCLIGSLVYSATRLAPLEEEIKQKSARISELADREAALETKIQAATKEYELLRENIEKLYAVKVTSENLVYEVKATAKATGEKIGNNPAYNFSLYVNAPAATLNNIEKVTYYFDHDTFQNKLQVSTDRQSGFRVGYYGWGCLTKVTTTLLLTNGETQSLDINMCQSLGGGWWHD